MERRERREDLLPEKPGPGGLDPLFALWSQKGIRVEHVEGFCGPWYRSFELLEIDEEYRQCITKPLC